MQRADTNAPTAFFWDLAAPMLAREGVSDGTMMGFPCLRVRGAFFASCDHRSGDLIVKLPRERVTALIAAGEGLPFAPAGRVFKEWFAGAGSRRGTLAGPPGGRVRLRRRGPVMAAEVFAGFPATGLAFLRQLPTRDKAWFAAHRPDYEQTVLDPAKAFVEAIGARLQREVSPAIVVEPRVNGAIAPINRDLRFSADKVLYKDHLLFRWWEGGEKRSAPTLFIRLSADEVGFATGLAFATPDRWRERVADAQSGAALAHAIETLHGYKPIKVAGADLKRPPAPWAADHPRSALLRHKALFQVRWSESLATAVATAECTEWCVERLLLCAEIHRWLVAHLG